MRCNVCGEENREAASYCTRCGSCLKETVRETAGETVEETAGEIVEETAGKEVEETAGKTEMAGRVAAEEEQQQKKAGRKRKKWLYVCAVVTIAVLCGAGGYFYKARQEEKAYETYIESAKLFLEDKDYEGAKNSYHIAINYYPEKTDAYIGLLDVCIVQKDFGEAKKALEQAEKVCEEGTRQTAERKNLEKKLTEYRQIIAENQETAEGETAAEVQATDKKQEENLISYSWHLNPSVEADNIDYVTDADYNERSLNELCCQYSSPYAVVRQGDSLGLIDMDGNLKTDMQYESIVNYVGDYCLVEKGAEEGEGTYVMSSDNDDLINILDLGFGYVVYNWYYCDGLHEPNEFDETFRMDDPPQVGIPIRNSRELIDEEGGSWEEQLKDSRYAIWVWDKLTTDFVYDKCGSSSCGLMAVCRDGKWGYVNEWGETVIPMEYDASWKYYSNPYEMLELEVEYGGKILPEEMQEFCYAASEGYVPLCKSGLWEMRDAEGKVSIPAGEFEEIRPPYRGKCWVKKNGKWGVIELQEKDSSEEGE